MQPDESQRPDRWLSPGESESTGPSESAQGGRGGRSQAVSKTPTQGVSKTPTPDAPKTPSVFPNAPHLVPKRRGSSVPASQGTASPHDTAASEGTAASQAPVGPYPLPPRTAGIPESPASPADNRYGAGFAPTMATQPDDAHGEPRPDTESEPHESEPPPWPWPSLAPGIIELRPLAPAEIVIAAFRALRYNPTSMLIISAGAILVQTVLLNYLNFGSYFTQSGTQIGFNPLAVIGTLIEVIISTVLTAGIGFVIWHAARGKRPRPGPTWRAINAHIPSIVGIGGLITLVVVPMTLGVTVSLSLYFGGRDTGDTRALIMGIAGIAIMVASVLAILTRIACAPAVAILENATPMQALQRSTRLVRPRFWATLGTLALAFLPPIVVAAAVGYIPQLFEFSAQLSSIVTLVAVLVFQPYFAAVVALIYLDLRIRHENLPYSAHFVRSHL